MINLALVALLSGSLLLGSPDGEKPDGTKKDATTTEQADTESAASQSIVVIGNDDEDEMPSDEEDITNDTFALGRSADEAPIKLWVSYAYSVLSEVYDENGQEGDFEASGFVPGEVVGQRIYVGGQINLINFPRFKFGGGAQLGLGQNVFTVENGSGTFPVAIQNIDPATSGQFPVILALGDVPYDEIETAFGLQSIKIYGMLQGKTLGIHGGYIIDLGEEREFTQGDVQNVNTPFGTNVTASGYTRRSNFDLTDNQDAIFFGADFDYPANWIRLFGGIDYFMLLEKDVEDPLSVVDPLTGNVVSTVEQDETLEDGNDLIVMKAGVGFRVSFFEIGAAAQIRTQIDRTVVSEGFANVPGAAPASGGHHGSLIPYLIIRPPNFPAALSLKGGVQREYADYGYALGGGNDLRTSFGFTATLSVGFN
ncbi:MAG: hypothetical protein AAGF99_00720 [Bacteroidota bacterium]